MKNEKSEEIKDDKKEEKKEDLLKIQDDNVSISGVSAVSGRVKKGIKGGKVNLKKPSLKRSGSLPASNS